MSLYTEVRGNDSDSHHGDNLLYTGYNCAYTARQIKNACGRGNGRRHRHRYRCPAEWKTTYIVYHLFCRMSRKNARIYRANDRKEYARRGLCGLVMGIIFSTLDYKKAE